MFNILLDKLEYNLHVLILDQYLQKNTRAYLSGAQFYNILTTGVVGLEPFCNKLECFSLTDTPIQTGTSYLIFAFKFEKI